MSNVYYWPFEYGRQTKANGKLQERLHNLGFYNSDMDNIFGQETKKALESFQINHGLAVTGEVDRKTEDLLFPGNFERRTPSMNITSNWLSGIVTSTGFKYLLTIASTWLAAKFGLDGDMLLAILTQIVGVFMGLWGMWEAAKSKVVVNGKVTNLANVSTVDQKKAAEIVADDKGVPVSQVTK